MVGAPLIGDDDDKVTVIRERIVKHQSNVKELAVILKSLSSDGISLGNKTDLILLAFTSSEKTSKYELIPYLWNFLRVLYKDMNMLMLKLIPAIALNRSHELTEKQVKTYREILTPLCYVMVYKKDDSTKNLEIICNNVLILSKYLLKEKNYTDFFCLLQDTFFNPKHSYQFKLLPSNSEHMDWFLEQLLKRFLELRQISEDDRNPSRDDLFVKLNQYLLFYLNYESSPRASQSQFKLVEKYVTVMFNLDLLKCPQVYESCLKTLNYFIQLIKPGCTTPTNWATGFYRYMTRICEESVMNSSTAVVDTLATLALIVERNKLISESFLQQVPIDVILVLVKAIKLTVNLSVEPSKTMCEVKDCQKGGKKHTITNWVRFAMKLFVAYLDRVEDISTIDQDLLINIRQLMTFHFHVLGRMQCTSKAYNEYNDIRLLYKAVSQKPKADPPTGLLKVFEMLLRYSFSHNLSALVNPLVTLLMKYYGVANDVENFQRIEWLNILTLAKERKVNATEKSLEAFDTACYNWAVKKQTLAKEEVLQILSRLQSLEFDFETNIFDSKINHKLIFTYILECVAKYNYKAFNVVQECLVEEILKQPIYCPFEMANLLFHAPDAMLPSYRAEIDRFQRLLMNQYEKQHTDEIAIALATFSCLRYSAYVEEVKIKFKSLDINAILNRDVNLVIMSAKQEMGELKNLRDSLNYLQSIAVLASDKSQLTPSQSGQILGILKRNIRHFQLARLDLEEVKCCDLLYRFASKVDSMESRLLAMSNLFNHVPFIVNDPICNEKCPHLMRTIANEGYPLFCNKLKQLPLEPEGTQILVVFGICNMIKLNAVLGRRSETYQHLRYLKEKIDASKKVNEDKISSVAEMQYILISYQLFLRYSTISEVNHLAVIREIFSAVRLLYKATDLYTLYLYDILVDIMNFSLPRYELKGLDYYICTALKYFTGLGSVPRLLDVLLIYCNWTLHCENMEKCRPVMEYIGEIMAEQPKQAISDIIDDDKENVKGNKDEFIPKMKALLGQVTSAPAASLHSEIVGFKLNCLFAWKCYIVGDHQMSVSIFDHSWKSYEAIYKNIANLSTKLDLKQFFITILFQSSHLYSRLDMYNQSYGVYKHSVTLIEAMDINRMALRQEADFHDLKFIVTPQRGMGPLMDQATTVRPNSPVRSGIAAKTKKRLNLTAALETASGGEKSKTRPRRQTTKTPAKLATIVIKEDTPEAKTSGKLGPIVLDKDAEVAKKKPSQRKIPVRKSSKTTATASVATTTSTSTRRGKSEIPELAIATTNRKITRRMI